MSLPRDTERDPHADALLTSALSAVDGVEVEGCPDAEVIGLYAERALAGAELRTVEAHVQTCARCQATVQPSNCRMSRLDIGRKSCACLLYTSRCV